MENSRLKARDMLVDFADTVFLVFLISFCVFYFIVGSNFDIAQKIVKAAFTLSWVGIIFLIKLKTSKVHIRKLVREGRENEIVAYFSKSDKLKDLLIISSYTLIIISVGFWSKTLDRVDFFQGIMIFLFAYFWHLNFFSPKEDASRLMCATAFDKLKDEIFTYFLPLFLIAIAFMHGEVNDYDIIQSLLIFFVSYFKHKKILFSENSDF